MTPDRDIEDTLQAWLARGVDEMPDRVFITAFDRIDATPQRRRFAWPSLRFPPMMLRIALLAGLVLAVVAGVPYLGSTLLTDQPPPVASPSPSPSVGPGVPAALRHRWIGTPVNVGGLSWGHDRAILDMTGIATEPATAPAPDLWLYTGGFAPLLDSTVTLADDGRLDITAENGTSGCSEGQRGSYDWSLSAGGSVLTLATPFDACNGRALSVSGTWYRVACQNADQDCLGEVEAGTYPSQFVEPRWGDGEDWRAHFGAIDWTVPDGWANSADWPDHYTLQTQESYAAGGEDPWADAIAVWVNPAAHVIDDCTGTDSPTVERSVSALAEYVRTHPGLDVDDLGTVEIDGHEAFVFDVALDAEGAWMCGTEGPLALIFTQAGAEGWDVGAAGDDRFRIILVDLGNEDEALITVDTTDPAELPAFVQQAMPIVESMRFAD